MTNDEVQRILDLTRDEVGRAAARGEIETLHALAQEAQQTMRAEVVGAWLDRRLPMFDDRTARELIAEGHAGDVLHALQRFNAGLPST